MPPTQPQMALPRLAGDPPSEREPGPPENSVMSQLLRGDLNML